MTNPTHLSEDRRVDVVRAVLTQPRWFSHVDIAAAVGCSHDTVRKIRLGLRHCDILPNLPRMTTATYQRRCRMCVQWEPDLAVAAEPCDGYCKLGIPEAAEEGQHWARSCAAFAHP